jgi:hypothetical protein
MKQAILCAGLVLLSCENQEAYEKRRAAEKWNEECLDESTMVATTAGSPNSASCTNRLHRMKVQSVTLAGEEIGALVFCECQREVKP